MKEMRSTNNNEQEEMNEVERRRKALEDISIMVELAEQASTLTYEVIVRSKDWKVCSSLYLAFEEVVLAISHDELCIVHCSLDRGISDYVDTQDDDDPNSMRERGQIIYYMARSRGL